MLGLDIRLESISLSGSSLGSSFVHADKDNASLRENSSTLHINIGHDIGVISFPLNEGSGNFSSLHIPIDSGLSLKDFIATIKYVSCTIINRHGKLQSYGYIGNKSSTLSSTTQVMQDTHFRLLEPSVDHMSPDLRQVMPMLLLSHERFSIAVEDMTSQVHASSLSSYSCVLNLGIGFYDMSINPMKDLRLHPTTRRLVLHKSSSSSANIERHNKEKEVILVPVGASVVEENRKAALAKESHEAALLGIKSIHFKGEDDDDDDDDDDEEEGIGENREFPVSASSGEGGEEEELRVLFKQILSSQKESLILQEEEKRQRAHEVMHLKQILLEKKIQSMQQQYPEDSLEFSQSMDVFQNFMKKQSAKDLIQRKADKVIKEKPVHTKSVSIKVEKEKQQNSLMKQQPLQIKTKMRKKPSKRSQEALIRRLGYSNHQGHPQDLLLDPKQQRHAHHQYLKKHTLEDRLRKKQEIVRNRIVKELGGRDTHKDLSSKEIQKSLQPVLSNIHISNNKNENVVNAASNMIQQSAWQYEDDDNTEAANYRKTLPNYIREAAQIVQQKIVLNTSTASIASENKDLFVGQGDTIFEIQDKFQQYRPPISHTPIDAIIFTKTNGK